METHPTLDSLVSLIGQKQPLQKKNLDRYLADCSPEFLAHAEQYLKNYLSFLETRGTELEFVADAYLVMVRDILYEQTRFLKSRQYRYATIAEANEHVYSNAPYMYKYMIGVAVSQFLWRNHRDMFLFFSRHIQQQTGQSYLEVGPGHGLLLLEALNSGRFERYLALDISHTSLDISRHFTQHCLGSLPEQLEFKLQDVTNYQTEERFDFITMGEVLEHLEQPEQILIALYDLLKVGGQAYLSTCANCPVMDHIYLYHSVDEIRQQLESVGFTIVDEAVISVDQLPPEQWEQRQANLSYACIVRK